MRSPKTWSPLPSPYPSARRSSARVSLGGLAGLLAEGSATEPLLSALVLVDIAPRLELPGVSRIVGFMTAHPNGFASLEEAAEAVSAYLPHRPRPNDLGGLAKNLRTGKDGRYRWHWDPAFLSGDCNINPAEFTDRMLGCSKRLSIPTLLVRGGLSDVLSEEACRGILLLVCPPSSCRCRERGSHGGRRLQRPTHPEAGAPIS